MDEQALEIKIKKEIDDYLKLAGELKPTDSHIAEIRGMVEAYVQVLKWMGVVDSEDTEE